MAQKFFFVSLHNVACAEAELNTFLRTHAVLSMERHWVEQGSASHWAICVDYLEPTGSSTAGPRSTGGKAKIDYRELLPDDQFAVFAKLRELRKTIAQDAAVPVYAIFANDQLARMVQARAVTKSDLEQITGVGDARVAKYGARVLEFLQQQWSGADATGGKSG